MSDPRYPDRPPGYDSSRRLQDRDQSSYIGWIIGGVAVIVVLGILVFGLGDRTQTASDPTPGTTTGQTNRPPAAPAPGANPAPQTPQNPAPAPRP